MFSWSGKARRALTGRIDINVRFESPEEMVAKIEAQVARQIAEREYRQGVNARSS